MKKEQKFKYKDASGKMAEKTLTLEFRDIDRGRAEDGPLFYAAMDLVAQRSENGSLLLGKMAQDMGDKFVNQLLKNEPDKTDFALLKKDYVAMYDLNVSLLVEIIIPFITAN